MKYFLSLAVIATLFLGCGEETSQQAKQTQTHETPTQTVVEKEAPVAQTQPQPTQTQPAEISAQQLYSKCAGCHGADGKTKALGKSNPIAGWSKTKLIDAINGYKDGSRNVHGMGAVMKGQVATMDEKQIEAVAEYISTLH